ncbi:golgin candidate 1 isoform X1 [Solanum dulcamara]|uniref:golgin candidate 1 isoform X1 n=1 Tax=Solanum dulcamara TaxID=45834 RepID=UPI002484EF07|nr:golgin candidate 1 isoform X1 [Solanum dulcamara]XP_055800561.1 golgin candidate 1 isoform X1 [Solanum dulcamara]
MASWLRAAEDLFEVVDKRAKSVVGENSDEQPNVRSPVPNEKGSQTKRSRHKKKPQKRLSSNEPSETVNFEREQASQGMSQSEFASDKDKAIVLTEDSRANPGSPSSKTSTEDKLKVSEDGALLDAPISETASNNELNHHADHVEAAEPVDVKVVSSESIGEHTSGNTSDIPGETPLLPIAKVVDTVQDKSPVDSSQNTVLLDAGSPVNFQQERSKSLTADEHGKIDKQMKDAKTKAEPNSDQKQLPKHETVNPGEKQLPERKTINSSIKEQEQLEEAQGLLKNATSTGHSKEARLARVCAGLSSRLQEYKSENAQLEELLVAERELSKSCEARIKQLQKDLSAAKKEVSKAGSSMTEALAAKNAEIEALVSSTDALKKQAALSEGNLASLQANMESLMRNRELTETRMMQALREELGAAERRSEEERAAHNATKKAFMEREVELEHRALEASTALARAQRTADERTAKATELEQKVALLEVECATLNQEMQDMEARTRRGQKKSSEEANQVLQMHAWQEEVERARQGQREAESKLASLEAEMQKLRVETAAMKRDAEHYSRQEHVELEKRYRELTDLLYYKQTQLEAMASEKAAAEFQLEKEAKRLQEVQLEADRNRASRRASSSWEEDTDIKALEPLPLHHRHMTRATVQLQKAAKLLDSGAVRATRFLWRYPTARVILLFYLVFVHLFLMYLLHRLQEQADTFASKEVAISMGLGNQTLP